VVRCGPVRSFATVLLTLLRCGPSQHIHRQSFGQFEEISYLFEKLPDLTLPDFVHCDCLSQNRFPEGSVSIRSPQELLLAGLLSSKSHFRERWSP
jgi:hypothetical protein